MVEDVVRVVVVVLPPISKVVVLQEYPDKGQCIIVGPMGGVITLEVTVVTEEMDISLAPRWTTV